MYNPEASVYYSSDNFDVKFVCSWCFMSSDI